MTLQPLSVNLPASLVWANFIACFLLLVFAWRSHFLRNLERQHRWRITILILLGAYHVISMVVYGFMFWHTLSTSTQFGLLASFHEPLFASAVTRKIQYLLAGWLAALVLGIVLGAVVHRQKGQGWIDQSDIFLLVLSTAIVGWPNVLYFLAITFILALLWLIVLIIARRRTIHDRLVITPAIIPAALVSIFFQDWFNHFINLQRIRF